MKKTCVCLRMYMYIYFVYYSKNKTKKKEVNLIDCILKKTINYKSLNLNYFCIF